MPGERLTPVEKVIANLKEDPDRDAFIDGRLPGQVNIHKVKVNETSYPKYLELVKVFMSLLEAQGFSSLTKNDLERCRMEIAKTRHISLNLVDDSGKLADALYPDWVSEKRNIQDEQRWRRMYPDR